MPKVYLTEEARREAREAEELRTLTVLIKTAKGRLDKEDREMAREAGISADAFARYKKPGTVAQMSLSRARRLAHAVGCTKEEWLKIGGYGKET